EGLFDLRVGLRLQAAHLRVEQLPNRALKSALLALPARRLLARPGVRDRDVADGPGLGLLEPALDLLQGLGGTLPLPLEVHLEGQDLGRRPLRHRGGHSTRRARAIVAGPAWPLIRRRVVPLPPHHDLVLFAWTGEPPRNEPRRF